MEINKKTMKEIKEIAESEEFDFKNKMKAIKKENQTW